MPYRRTDNVIRKQAARHGAIIESARLIAAEGGMAAVQIAPVAERAGIAAGTVYRYFPSKTELVGALIAAIAEREIGAMRRAADAAPGRSRRWRPRSRRSPRARCAIAGSPGR